MKDRLERLLSADRVWIVAACAAFLVGLPSLFGGEFFDDHLMRAWAQSDRPIWDAFSFAPPGEVPALREQGMFGWWSADDLSVHFFRPLSSLTHALDHALWPDAVWFMHLENVLLYALLAGLVARLIERIQGPGLATGIAALVFAIDESHGATVGWLSARNTMLALIFGVVAMLCHLRWRSPAAPDAARVRWAVAGVASLVLALLSAEAGLCCAGCLVAWSLCFEKTWRARLMPIVPYVTVIVAWRVAHVAGGFGVTSSSIYLDIAGSPLTFGFRALIFPLAMGTAQLTLPLVDLILSLPVMLPVLVALFFVLSWALLPLLRADPRARFWLLAMLLSSMPIAATFPTARTLMMIGVGGSALVGLVFERRRARREAGQEEPKARGAGLRRVILGFIVVCNLVVAPLSFVPLSFASQLLEPPHRLLAEQLSEDAELCVVLNMHMELTSLYPGAMRESAGRPWPNTYILFAGVDSLEVERTDTRTLELSSAEGWAAKRVDRFTRDWSQGFEVGAQVELDHARVRVLEIEASGRPTRIQVTFDRNLEEVVIYGFGRDDATGLELEPWSPRVGESAHFLARLER